MTPNRGRGRLAVAVALALVVGASTALRIWLGGRSPSPLIPDEFVYSELAQSFADSRSFSLRGHPLAPWSFGPLYPIAVAAVYGLVDDAYGA